jgi:hypothetical protein
MDANQFLGGNPLAVVIRLVLLSVVAGIVLSALGITPDNLFYSLEVLARRISDMGFGVVRWALGYLILGAMVVVPIWFLARLFGLLGRRDGT